MINAELRVAMLLDLEETKQMSAPEMQELQLLQAAAALKASALHLNDQNAWKSVEKHDEAQVKVEVILPALKGFERFFEKGAEKYNFDFGRVSDLSRCTIQIYDNHKAAAVNKMVEVTKRLLGGAKDGDCPYTSQPYKVIKCTNKFFANRDKGGYMDLGDRYRGRQRAHHHYYHCRRHCRPRLAGLSRC